MKKLFKSVKAFTLIELLVVIAVLGVLAAGVLIAINPVDKLNAANDSKVQTDIAALANAAEAYAVSHNGFYVDGDLTDANTKLQAAGETKIPIVAPSNYTYTYDSVSVVPPLAGSAFDNACTAGTTCTAVVLTGTLKSKKYTATPVQRYESVTGKTCQVATATTVCP